MIKWRTHQSNVVWLGQASNDWPCKIGWFMAKNCRTFLTHWIRYLGMWLTIYQRNISCWFVGHTTPNFSTPYQTCFSRNLTGKAPSVGIQTMGFPVQKSRESTQRLPFLAKRHHWDHEPIGAGGDKRKTAKVSLLGHFFLHAWSCWRIKSDSETFPDCATRIAQLFGRIAQLGLRNSQDCATLLAQLLGLRNSACATTFDRFRNSQDCATLWSDCATTVHRLRNSQDCATLGSDCATTFDRLRNSQDCATLGSDCATTFDRLRNSQDCATLWSDCATTFDRLRNSQDCATLQSNCVTTGSLESPQG